MSRADLDFRRILRRLRRRFRDSQPQRYSVLAEYVTRGPSAHNAVDIFRGEWASGGLGLNLGGTSSLFDDSRIDWAVSEFGGVEGMSVLELGPLEAAHTWMLEQHGVASVVAIEANTRAFLKCLIIKELLGLNRSRFLCGDFIEFLKHDPPRFDLILASGVLYHMREPAQLLQLMAGITDRAFIWTHYYDEKLIAKGGNSSRFSAVIDRVLDGVTYQLHRHEYGATLDARSFCGGDDSYSYWMTREGLMTSLRQAGFEEISIGLEQPNHPLGPALGLVARG